MELAHLCSCWEKALAGERHMVFVTGESGIGKTTLVEAFLAEIRQHGSLPPNTLYPTPWISWGQCVEHYGPGEPYMPILEALGRLCREPDGERLIALLTQYAPTWLKQMPSLLEATALEALQHRTQGATQERMLRELAEALEVMTTERPLILWLEDLHWSDPSTVTLLSLLARRCDPARLLVMGTYRPEELHITGHPLHDLVSDLLAHRRCHELPVSLLTEEAVAEYIRTRFSVSVTPISFVRALFQCTEGHPFFLVNMLDDLVDRQFLKEVDGTWTSTQDLAAVMARMPNGVWQLLARQQARLEPPERLILEAASLAGQEFTAATVAAALAAEVMEVSEQCAQLAQRRQFLAPAGVVEWPDGIVTTRYRFQHALQQQMWHERIPLERRQQWHRRMGERLEAAYGSHVGEIAVELAVHFEQGREYRKAIHYLHQSGENALQVMG